MLGLLIGCVLLGRLSTGSSKPLTRRDVVVAGHGCDTETCPTPWEACLTSTLQHCLLSPEAGQRQPLTKTAHSSTISNKSLNTTRTAFGYHCNGNLLLSIDWLPQKVASSSNSSHMARCRDHVASRAITPAPGGLHQEVVSNPCSCVSTCSFSTMPGSSLTQRPQ